MLLLCVASAEEANRSRPLLSLSVGTLLDTARDPLPDHWDQTLDLPQVSRNLKLIVEILSPSLML